MIGSYVRWSTDKDRLYTIHRPVVMWCAWKVGEDNTRKWWYLTGMYMYMPESDVCWSTGVNHMYTFLRPVVMCVWPCPSSSPRSLRKYITWITSDSDYSLYKRVIHQVRRSSTRWENNCKNMTIFVCWSVHAAVTEILRRVRWPFFVKRG